MKLILTITLFLTLIAPQAQGLTEKHETDSYGIKYPNSWTLFKDDDLGEAIHVVAPKSGGDDEFTENVSVIVQDLSGYNIDLDNYVKLAEKQIEETVNEGTILSSQRFEAGTVRSHKIIYKGEIKGFNLKLIRYYQLKNEKAYILTYTALDKDFEKHKLFGQQILNSFRLK